MMKTQRFLLLALIVGLALLLTVGCDLLFPPGNEATAVVDAVVSVTGNSVSGSSLVANTVGPAAVSACGDAPEIAVGERVSFNPTSMKIRVLGIYISDAVSGGTEAAVLEQNQAQEIELAGKSAFQALFERRGTIGQSRFGNYRFIKILYGDNMVGGSIDRSVIRMSGSVCRDGTVVSFTDLEIPMGSTGRGLPMPNAIPVNAGSSTVVRALFDVKDYPSFIRKTEAESYYPKVPGTDDVYIVADNPVFLPYAGTGNPTVEWYKVTVEGTSNWYQRIVVFKNNAGKVVAVQWYPVFEGGVPGSLLEFGSLFDFSVTENSGGTYRIEDTTSTSYKPDPARVIFPAFQMGNHVGTFTRGGTPYTYTATKL